MRKRIFTVIGALLLVACASRQRGPTIVVDDEKGNPELEKGLKALEQERYLDAAQIFDRLLVAKPATEVDLVILYNSGAAYEGLNQCAKAADRYRQVVRSSAGRFMLIEGPSLYRLSLMYECLGQDTKAVAALLDTKKRGKTLPNETLTAEIPARLAAAYARINNREKAIQYFSMASEGLKKLVAQPTQHKQKEILSRTMYLMGQLSAGQRQASVPPNSYMPSISMQQPYLLQAIEMDHPNWSKRAAEDLLLAYDNIWRFNLTDPEDKRRLYTRGLQAIQELRKIRLPDSPPTVGSVFGHLDKIELKLQNELATVAEINRLTPEAERREGLKRQGKLIDPPKAAPKAKRR